MNRRDLFKLSAGIGLSITPLASLGKLPSITIGEDAMEFVSGNVYIREMKFEKAGDATEGHEHNFDHTTYIVSGALKIEQLDASGNVVKFVEKHANHGQNWVLIKAGVKHRITALEDNSLGHCIYSHRTPQGTIVQNYDGWQPAFV